MFRARKSRAVVRKGRPVGKHNYDINDYVKYNTRGGKHVERLANTLKHTIGSVHSESDYFNVKNAFSTHKLGEMPAKLHFQALKPYRKAKYFAEGDLVLGRSGDIFQVVHHKTTKSGRPFTVAGEAYTGKIYRYKVERDNSGRVVGSKKIAIPSGDYKGKFTYRFYAPGLRHSQAAVKALRLTFKDAKKSKGPRRDMTRIAREAGRQARSWLKVFALLKSGKVYSNLRYNPKKDAHDAFIAKAPEGRSYDKMQRLATSNAKPAFVKRIRKLKKASRAAKKAIEAGGLERARGVVFGTEAEGFEAPAIVAPKRAGRKSRL